MARYSYKRAFSLIIALFHKSLSKRMTPRSQKILALVGLIVIPFGGISLFNDSFILGMSSLAVGMSIGVVGALSVVFSRA
ncbi:hypothetical protein AYR66_13210 [Noviherbaspirillum denitrificans]|uniref:Uncharacterized protein n=1 Tax=Noviherbaspirillum denitrificans TaxID=1968433 RepID=A0A254TCD0_9BURK|nr:hypothetical protein AYR66_13210 [Noviherbaspirillum denitrificans]